MVSVDDVLAFVNKNPGSEVRVIMNGLGLSYEKSDVSNTRRKLRSLERYGLVKAKKEPSPRKKGAATILHYYPGDE